MLIKPIIIPDLKYSKIIKLNNEYKKTFTNEKIIFLDIIDELLEDHKIYWDLERSEFFGTKTSLYGQDLQAKLLGLKVLPSIFNQKIKSIIFDLDDTLYTGVVGEDGIKKIYLDKNNNQSWCKDVEIKPELLKHNKVGDFTGFNNLEYTGVDPRPMENLDVDESSYPFNINMVNTDFLNLDNKQIK